MTRNPLDIVRRATTRRATATHDWRRAVAAAAADDRYSLREVGAAAGISHVRVLDIAREEGTRP